MSFNVTVCMSRVTDIAVESGDPSPNCESKMYCIHFRTNTRGKV